MISIITAYYNRKKLFIQTLKSIQKTVCSDFEFIVVDDASNEEERLEDIVIDFPFVKLIRIEKKDKTWVCPCIPFNLAISKVNGDKIIFQNPECLHVGDVLKYVNENLSEYNYLVMPTYALNKTFTNVLEYKQGDALKPFFEGLPQQAFSNGMGWYHHSKFRPVYYHFCSAITRNNLKKLGGFDERFADGIAYDDNELVERIKRLGLILYTPNEKEVAVIHQFHEKSHYPLRKEYLGLVRKNEYLYSLILKETKIKVFNRYE